MSAARNATVATILVALAACSSFSNLGAYGLRKAVPSGKGVLVYGLDASNGPLRVAIAPVMGVSCQPQTKAESPKGATGTTYFTFEVPAGNYAVSAFGTSGIANYHAPDAVRSSDPASFEVPAGRKVFIGTFSLEPDGDFKPLRLKRELIKAKEAIGAAATTLELASVFSMSVRFTTTPFCAF